jgi:hypothetical protein
MQNGAFCASLMTNNRTLIPFNRLAIHAHPAGRSGRQEASHGEHVHVPWVCFAQSERPEDWRGGWVHTDDGKWAPSWRAAQQAAPVMDFGPYEDPAAAGWRRSAGDGAIWKHAGPAAMAFDPIPLDTSPLDGPVPSRPRIRSYRATVSGPGHPPPVQPTSSGCTGPDHAGALVCEVAVHFQPRMLLFMPQPPNPRPPTHHSGCCGRVDIAPGFIRMWLLEPPCSMWDSPAGQTSLLGCLRCRRGQVSEQRCPGLHAEED